MSTSRIQPTSATGRPLRPDEIPAEGTPLYKLNLKVSEQYTSSLDDPEWRRRAITALHVYLYGDAGCQSPALTAENFDNEARRGALDTAVCLLRHTEGINRHLRFTHPQCYTVYEMRKDRDTDKRIMEATADLTKPLWKDWDWFRKSLVELAIERMAITEGEREYLLPLFQKHAADEAKVMTWKRPDGGKIEGNALYILQHKVAYPYTSHLNDPNYHWGIVVEVFKYLYQNPECTAETTDSGFRRAALEHAVSMVKRTVVLNRRHWTVRPECYVKYLEEMKEEEKGTDRNVMERTEDFTKPVWDDWEWFKMCMMKLMTERVAISEGERVMVASSLRGEEGVAVDEGDQGTASGGEAGEDVVE